LSPKEFNDSVESNHVSFAKIWSAVKRLMKVVVPAIASQLVCMMMETICLYFIGNANIAALTAGVGLANVYSNTLCQNFLAGLNNAITVLVSIAYGQGDLKQCEEILHRGRLLNLIGFFFLWPLCLFTYRILLLFNIEEDVASYAHTYSLFMFPALFFHTQFDTYRQYLNSTGLSQIVLYAFGATIGFHFALCYLMIEVLGLPVVSVGFSFLMTTFGNMAFVVVYSHKYAGRDVNPWGFLDYGTLLRREEVDAYLKISLPAIVMILAEWCAMDFMILLATQMGTVAIGSMTISLNYQAILTQVPYGFGIGISAVVGNAIGESNPSLAKTLNYISLALSLLCTSVMGYMTHKYAHQIAGFYTHDLDILPIL
jgi:Na+-driven multidrug efflux pump